MFTTSNILIHFIKEKERKKNLISIVRDWFPVAVKHHHFVLIGRVVGGCRRYQVYSYNQGLLGCEG